MISLILPYWQRRVATDFSLALLSSRYGGTPLEVVLVDDGSLEPYRPPSGLRIEVRVIRLPAKTIALNPCVPINVGVRAARGDVIALSNPEILHSAPVLPALLEELERGGPLTYVTAACWCPDQKGWHCHSTTTRRDLFQPEGSGFHFLSLMRRSLFDAAGGFDERYRDGQAYDDADWVLRVAAVGARFVLRDDVVVEHPWRSTKSTWSAGMLEWNRRLFFKTWGHLAQVRRRTC